MTRTIPGELTRGPFLVATAREAGLRWRDLQTMGWTRLSRGQYSSSMVRQDVHLKLRAVEMRMPPQYAFSGPTAAWLWGLKTAACAPIEVTLPREAAVRARAGTRVRRAFLPDSDVVVRRGFRVTSPLRTVCDLGSQRDLVESVVALDMALGARLVDVKMLGGYIETHRGTKGVRRLRRALGLANSRSESPMETRLRIALHIARLPAPQVQTDLHDATGALVGRVDLYYPDRRLVIEYDGEHHKERLGADLVRHNALLNAGYYMLRFTAADMRNPAFAAAEVRRVRTLLRHHSR